MAKGKGIVVSVASPEEPKKGYDGSWQDYRDDYRAADRRGVSREDHEDSARDRVSDKAGEKRVSDAEADKSNIKSEAPAYKAGSSAYKNTPKASHGFGHTGAQRQGHLRTSGHSGGHQIGKKKG